MTQLMGQIINTFAAEHIKAEARLRGDLDDATVKALAQAFTAGAEYWLTYGEAAEKIINLRNQDDDLDEPTCNALASYLIKRSLGHTHDAIERQNREFTRA